VTDVKGQTVLDPVLNVRLDQAWGFAGVSAALHDSSGGYYGTTTVTGHPDDKFGWAVAGSFLLNNVFGLGGDTIGAMAVFSRGASGYATSNAGTKEVFGSGNSIGFGFVADGVYAAPNGQIQLTDVWSVTGAYEHVWNPMWRTSVYGGFVGVHYNDQATTLICNGGLVGSGNNCHPDFSWSVVGTRTQWNPVPDLFVGVDLTWWHLNTAMEGLANLPASGARPAGLYKVEDQDTLSALFRVQRNFLY
jgi:hypothetical protein